MASGYQQLNKAIHEIHLTSDGRLSFGDFAMQTLVLSTIVSVILLIAIAFMCIPILANGPPSALGIGIGGALLLILSTFFTVAIFLLGARRCHDAGLPGSYQLLSLIPYAGPILYMGLMATDSVPPGSGYQEYNYDNQPKIRLDKLKASFRTLKPNFRGRMSFEQFARAQVSLTLITLIVSLALMIVGYVFMIFMLLTITATMADSNTSLLLATAPFFFIYGIGITILMFVQFSLMARRLHDTGRSGQNLWWCIFPLFGFAIPMLQCLADSESNNQYGPAITDFEWIEPQNQYMNSHNNF